MMMMMKKLREKKSGKSNHLGHGVEPGAQQVIYAGTPLLLVEPTTFRWARAHETCSQPYIKWSRVDV